MSVKTKDRNIYALLLSDIGKHCAEKRTNEILKEKNVNTMLTEIERVVKHIYEYVKVSDTELLFKVDKLLKEHSYSEINGVKQFNPTLYKYFIQESLTTLFNPDNIPIAERLCGKSFIILNNIMIAIQKSQNKSVPEDLLEKANLSKFQLIAGALLLQSSVVMHYIVFHE